jgi:uncharacterized protein (DUF2342 family)
MTAPVIADAASMPPCTDALRLMLDARRSSGCRSWMPQGRLVGLLGRASLLRRAVGRNNRLTDRTVQPC